MVGQGCAGCLWRQLRALFFDRSPSFPLPASWHYCLWLQARLLPEPGEGKRVAGPLRHSAVRPLSQSPSQPATQPASQPANRLASQPASQPAGQRQFSSCIPRRRFPPPATIALLILLCQTPPLLLCPLSTTHHRPLPCPLCSLNVRREHVFEDSFYQLRMRNTEELRARLK
jgi:hypothetical protein